MYFHPKSVSIHSKEGLACVTSQSIDHVKCLMLLHGTVGKLDLAFSTIIKTLNRFSIHIPPN